MNNAKTPKSKRQQNWAVPVSKLDVQDIPAGAINLNVQGKKPMSPLQGFGQLWQKTYRIRLEGVEVSPQAVIAAWKTDFQSFWPSGNYFYGPNHGVAPGGVAVLNLAMPAKTTLSTGVRIIYADDESFSFMTPQGHIFSGMNTFSASDDNGTTVVQIQALVRASDPIFELSLRLKFGHKQEDVFWHATLQNLAAHFGSENREVTQKNVCIDSKMQWSEAKNIWHNAMIRTTLYLPVHLWRRLRKKPL